LRSRGCSPHSRMAFWRPLLNASRPWSSHLRSSRPSYSPFLPRRGRQNMSLLYRRTQPSAALRGWRFWTRSARRPTPTRWRSARLFTGRCGKEKAEKKGVVQEGIGCVRLRLCKKQPPAVGVLSV
jgi:hypothetical protein